MHLSQLKNLKLLFDRRTPTEEVSNQLKNRFGFYCSSGSCLETNKKSRNVSKKSKKSKSQKENLISQRCKKCNQESFAKKKRQFCASVCSSSRSKSKCDKIVEIDCKKGKTGKRKLGKCQRCKKTKSQNSHKPLKSTLLSKPVDPQRSLLGQKKKCREEKDESESCRKLLNKCNSRVFRATHSGKLSCIASKTANCV